MTSGRLGSAVPESRRNLYLYVAAGSIYAIAAVRGLTVPLYAHQLGATRFEVGALFAAATITAAALSLPSGAFVDRFGARTLLTASLVITAGSQLATALTTSVPPLFLWQVLGGLAAGIQQAAVLSAVTESVSGARLGRAMGWVTLSMQLGFFLGPSVAGIALTWIDLRADIALSTALLALTLPGTLAASNSRQHGERGLGISRPLIALFAQPAFAQVTVGLLGMAITWGTMGAFLPVFGKEALGLPSAQVGYLLALQAIVNAASRIPAGRLADAVRERWKIVVAGVTGWSIAMVVLAHATGFVGPALILAAGTPFMAAAFVTVSAIFGELSSGSTRGIAMGMYGTILFTGLSAGPLLFGPIMQSSGYAAGFTACSAAGVALALGMVALRARQRLPNSAQSPAGDSERPAPAGRRA